MAFSVSLADMVTDVTRAADIENVVGTDKRFTGPEIRRYVRQSVARLYTLLDRLDYQYYLSEYTFSTTSGENAYALPADFWVLKGCKVQLSSGRSVRCTPFMPAEHVWLDNTAQWPAYGAPIFYRLAQDNLIFAPIPTGVYSVTISYTPTPPALADDTDTFDGIAGFERWVVLDAAIKCKQKDSLDPSLLVAEKAEVEAWITSLANTRDTGETQRISDVQSQDLLADVNVAFWQR